MERYGNEITVDIQVLTNENTVYLKNFKCGNVSIDYYFNKCAQNDDTSVTYLFIDSEKDRLIACMTISCSAIFCRENPEEEKLLSTCCRQWKSSTLQLTICTSIFRISKAVHIV